MKLFLVYLGGSVAGANIELHDVRFVVGENIEATYPALRQQWFGDAAGLHIDSYMQIKQIDGYNISLHSTPQDGALKLFFVNFGGYYPDKLAEQHEFTLCVAEAATQAKSYAKKQLLTRAESSHKDDLLEMDNSFAITQLDGYFVHLQPAATNTSQAIQPDWFGYNVIA